MNDISQKLAQLRREYVSHRLTKDSVDADPFVQFRLWFDEVLEAEQPDPDAMALSTVNAEARVSGRIVLLKGLDERGFIFFTNYKSRKGMELLANPYASLLFYWFTLNRQIRIEGSVEKVTTAESVEYFRTRPRGSQLGAWASPQSRTMENRAEIEERLAEIERRYADREIDCPPFWGGFRVIPESLEFWQGRENRLHDRILYERSAGGWSISRLAP